MAIRILRGGGAGCRAEVRTVNVGDACPRSLPFSGSPLHPWSGDRLSTQAWAVTKDGAASGKKGEPVPQAVLGFECLFLCCPVMFCDLIPAPRLPGACAHVSHRHTQQASHTAFMRGGPLIPPTHTQMGPLAGSSSH